MRTFPDTLTFCLSAATSALIGRRYLSCLWELTYRCTARCGKCGYWAHPGNQEDELTAAQIECGLDRVHAFGCRLVNFTGGEPTLRPDLECIVGHASRLGMWTSVVTNGSLLTRDRVRALREAGLDNLLVSLDSTSPSVHDDERGASASFSQVEACTRWIREEFLRGHRTGGIMCVITQRNTAELRDFAAFARDHGVFVLFQPYHVNKTGDPGPVPYLREAQTKTLVSMTRGRRSVLNSRRYLLGLNGGDGHPNRRPCHAGQKYFSVDPFGALHPCVDMPAVGHVLTGDITEVRSAWAQELVSSCQGCWYCFRGEADTSLSLAGCLEKVWLGVSVLRHNVSLTRRGVGRTDA
jgi:MoaA/NifB/PqqE/SkfB family radical SAM enzyme